VAIHNVERLLDLVGLQQKIDVPSEFRVRAFRPGDWQLLGLAGFHFQDASSITSAHDLGEGECRAVVERRGKCGWVKIDFKIGPETDPMNGVGARCPGGVDG
jgi:hypothetical protein